MIYKYYFHSVKTNNLLLTGKIEAKNNEEALKKLRKIESENSIVSVTLKLIK